MSAQLTVPTHVRLQILSPEQVLYEGRVFWVQVPLADGLIGIWPGHAPLVASLGRGSLQWRTGQGARDLEVESGVLRVDTDRCVVLVGGSRAAERGSRAAQTDALFVGLEETLSDTLSDDEVRELQEE